VEELVVAHSGSRSGAQLVLGAACWILALHNLAIEPIVAAAWPTPYSYSENAVSDLGITTCGPFENPGRGSVYVCSPRYALWNASLVAFGLLIIAGAILTRRAWPERRSTIVGLTLLAVAGAGVILIGLVPANVNLAVHGIAGLVEFVGQNVAMLVLAVATWGTQRWLAVFSLVCAAVGLAATVLFFSGQHLGLGVGGMERLAVNPFAAWLAVVGIWLLCSRWRRGRRRETAGRPATGR